MALPIKPVKLPRWATVAPTYLTEPPENGASADSKDNGWSGAKPPAGFMNWLFTTIYSWFYFLDLWFDNSRKMDMVGLTIAKSTATTITASFQRLGIGPWVLDGSYSPRTIDTAIVGAGGIDIPPIVAGVPDPDVWYAIWAMWNPATIEMKLMLSLSLTNHAAASGYTMSRRVGFVYSNAASEFDDFQIVNDEFLHLKDPELSLSGTETQDGAFHAVILNGKTSPDVMTEVRLQGRVGANLQIYGLRLRPAGSSWGVNDQNLVALALGSDYISGSGGASEYSTFSRSMLQTDTREIEYQASNGGSAGVVYMNVTGFKIPPFLLG